MYNEEDIDGTEEFMGAPNEIDPTAHLNEMVETKVPETKAQDLHRQYAPLYAGVVRGNAGQRRAPI